VSWKAIPDTKPRDSETSAVTECVVCAWNNTRSVVRRAQVTSRPFRDQMYVVRQVRRCITRQRREDASLKLTRLRIGSQCNWRSTGEMCSLRRAAVRSRAAAFWTDWTCRMLPWDTPYKAANYNSPGDTIWTPGREFWLPHVSMISVLDAVDAGDRNQTGIVLLHVLTVTTWSHAVTTPRSRADSTTLIVVNWSEITLMLIWLNCWQDPSHKTSVFVGFSLSLVADIQ